MAQLIHSQDCTGLCTLRARVAELAANPNARAIAVGVTAVALTPMVFPLVRPVLKSTIKSGVMLYEKTKSAIAETGEMLADVAAEARAEAHASGNPSLATAQLPQE